MREYTQRRATIVWSGSAGGRAGTGRAGPSSAVSFGAPPLRDRELLAWCENLIEQVLGGISPAAQDAAGE